MSAAHGCRGLLFTFYIHCQWLVGYVKAKPLWHLSFQETNSHNFALQCATQSDITFFRGNEGNIWFYGWGDTNKKLATLNISRPTTSYTWLGGKEQLQSPGIEASSSISKTRPPTIMTPCRTKKVDFSKKTESPKKQIDRKNHQKKQKKQEKNKKQQKNEKKSKNNQNLHFLQFFLFFFFFPHLPGEGC